MGIAGLQTIVIAPIRTDSRVATRAAIAARQRSHTAASVPKEAIDSGIDRANDSSAPASAISAGAPPAQVAVAARRAARARRDGARSGLLRRRQCPALGGLLGRVLQRAHAGQARFGRALQQRLGAGFAQAQHEMLPAALHAFAQPGVFQRMAQARDADVALNLSEEDGKKKARGAALAQYQEVWSFVRRRGKRSKQGVPALEGQCPSCGANLPISEVVKCEYCQALVNSGEHDWVLAEITQPEEWRAEPAVGQVPGLEELRSRDPSISRQELEDRVSVSFWKWVEARSTGKPDKLSRFCMQPPLDEAARHALALIKTPLREVAVGSADLKRIDSKDGIDRATLEIRWSAAADQGPPTHHRHSFVLGRAAQVQSRRGLSSLDCPSCGGPLASSDEVTCRYCNTPLTGGKHEWALLAVSERPEDKPAPARKARRQEHDQSSPSDE